MPVDNHPVHKRTKIKADKAYGCHNRQPFTKSYMGKDAVLAEFDVPGFRGKAYLIVAKRIDHVMSTSCRYDMSMNDPRCAGCCHVA